MKKGKFVVIEGLDGSGKTTQLKLLVKYCQRHGIKTAVVDFPQYYDTFFGKLVGRYLKGDFGDINQLSPYLCSLLYAGDRWQSKVKMDLALTKGELLLANRYTSSNMGFMGAKIKNKKERNKFIDWLKKLEWEIYGIPRPDLVIYLSVDPAIGQKLVDGKAKRRYLGAKGKRDIHESSLPYLRRVAGTYLELCKKFPNWVEVECLDRNEKIKSRQKIHQMVVGRLRRRGII